MIFLKKKFFLHLIHFNSIKGNLIYFPNLLNAIIVYHDFLYFYPMMKKYEQSEWVAYELKKEQVVNANFKRPFLFKTKKVKRDLLIGVIIKLRPMIKGICVRLLIESLVKSYEATF